MKSLICVSEDTEEDLFVVDYESTRKGFSDLWEQFLKVPLDADQYKRVLILLDGGQVLSNLSRPLLLTDFLMKSYDVGGSISILSLSGVFTLMQKHNLEFPDFYMKLYRLFQVLFHQI